MVQLPILQSRLKALVDYIVDYIEENTSAYVLNFKHIKSTRAFYTSPCLSRSSFLSF